MIWADALLEILKYVFAVTIVFDFCVAIFFLVGHFKEKIVKIYFASLLSMVGLETSMWLGTYVKYDPIVNNYIDRSAFLFGLLMLLFIVVFLRQYYKPSFLPTYLAWIVYASLIVECVFVLMGDVIGHRKYVGAFTYSYSLPQSAALDLYYILSAVVVLLIIVIITKINRAVKDDKLKRIQFNLIGKILLLNLLLILGINVLLPLFIGLSGADTTKFYSSAWYTLLQISSTILTSIWTVATAYAITRYRFLDISLMIRKAVISFLVLVLSIAIVIIVLLGLQAFVEQITGLSNDILILTAVAIILFIYKPLQHLVERLVDRFIFTDYIDLSVRVHEFQRAMPHINNVESIGESVAKMLRETYHVQDVWFLVYDHISKDRIISRWPYREEIILPFTDPLLQLCHEDMHIMVKDELMAKEHKTDLERKAIKQLDYLKTKVAVPFGQPKWCFGMLLLGPKTNDQPFTVEEIKSLNSLANSLKMEVPQVANVQMMIDDARRQRGLEV